MSETRIIICGGREFADRNKLFREMDQIIKNIDNPIIISGKARGADRLGEEYAKSRHIRLMEFPANWDKYGKSAGYRRNAEMLKYAMMETPMIVAFWDGESRGTKNMIETAQNSGADVRIIRY